MKKQPSPGEWQILLAMWRLDRKATLDEIVRELGSTPPPSDGKIRTILNRLIEKGYVRSATKQPAKQKVLPPGRPAIRRYWPAKKREDATKAEIRRFMSVYLGEDPKAVGLLEEIAKERFSGRRRRRSRKS